MKEKSPSKIEKISAIAALVINIWKDRHIHMPAFREGLKSLPSKFMATDRVQKRNLLIAIASIIMIQILVMVASF